MHTRRATLSDLPVLIELMRGYGRKLLECAASSARDLGVVALHLEVDRGNTAAQQLYESLGYHRRDRYFVMTL